MIVFVNLKSGGREVQSSKNASSNLIRNEQVFDLTEMKPNKLIRYGLGCLEVLAAHGDQCAEEIRENMRVVVLYYIF
ncbi:hypothetical protein Bca4012_025313 [Brassica carinata]|uniref:Uncharacterized protein n=1 Tax=Brassica carinata TaxID=52824 RepID=A0A8X7VFZ0_BRACI|nr:hypothetical protein Bca52824_022360 [Brassica carinata]